MRKEVRYIGLSLFLVLVSAPLFSQVVSDFSIDADGWTVADIGGTSVQTVVWNNTGGNPGGYVSLTAAANGIGVYWKAPAKFLGGHCLDAYGMNLKFDLQVTGAGVINSPSNLFGSLRLTSASAATSIVIALTPVPAITPGWTSYTVRLDETTPWRNTQTTGTVSTHADILAVLANLSKIEIVAQAFALADPDVSLDNVILEQGVLGTPPTITTFSPQAGVPNVTDVTIGGSNFNAAPSGNAVYFGGVLATVTTASATQLTVKVPAGAKYEPITVVDKTTGLSGSSGIPFQPRFDNNKDYGGRIIRASMAPYVLFNVTSFTGWNEAGDIDGDGLNDLVVGEATVTKFSVLRNAGLTGTITSSSFLAPVSFNLTTSGSKGFIALADFDGDGKLDVAVSSSTAASATVSVFHNTSTPGVISFGTPLVLTGYSYSDGPITTADMDGDGRPEILSVFNNSCGSNVLYIYPNRSTPGNIDFCGFTQYGPVTTCGGYIGTGDLDGDRKPDVIVEAGTVTVFRNTSTPGSITLAAPFTLTTAAVGKPLIADLDNDGKNDIGWPVGANSVEVRKNNYSGGAFDATAFSAGIVFGATVGVGAELIAGDMNSDGKMDLMACGDQSFSILQNVTTPGTLNTTSFLPGIPYGGTANYVFVSPRVVDLDGDNKPDFFMRTSNGSGAPSTFNIYVFHNESYPVPRIDSYSPVGGTTGGTITLTGDYMNTANATPLARLEGILAASATSGNTSSTVTIPPGTKSGSFSLTEHGLTGFSKPFNLVFGTNRTIDATSFASSIDFALAGNTRDALTVADFDDDGKVDAGVIDNLFTAKIFQNTAVAGTAITSSSLSLQATTYTSGYNMVALDIDGDGKIDLNNGYGLLENNSTPGSISFLGGPNGAYTYSGGFNYVAPADFNKDGKVDLAVSNGSAFVQVYENESSTEPFVNNGYFSTLNVTPVNLTKPGSSGGIVAVDFDGDGYDDIATTNPVINNFTVYRNLAVYGPIASTSFSTGTNIATGTQPYSLAAADFDGDGKPDLAITHFNAASLFVSVYLNTSTSGSITFAAPVNLTCLKNGYNIAAQDLDGDGKAEIVVIHQPNPGPGSFSIFQNTGTSGNISFGSVVNYPTINHNPQALAIADINLDQKPDILIVAAPTPGTNALMVFENKIVALVITVTTQPADVIVCVGATATITTAALGTTNISYQWQFAPTSAGPFADLGNGAAYSGVTTNTLSVNTVGNFGAGRYRCNINGDFANAVLTNDEGLFINAIPAAPTTVGASICGPGSLSLTASGGSNGNYRWYTTATGGTATTGEVSSTYITPIVGVSTTYYVSLMGGSCESSRTPVLADVINIPADPSATGAFSCGPGNLSLTASGGSNGNYRWYTIPTGGAPLGGEVNSVYTTPLISASTTYYVSLLNGVCESNRTASLADIRNIPAAPSVTGATACAPASVTLKATGGSNGQYRWYSVASAGTAITGEVNDTYLTPLLGTATTYFVSVNDGFCESSRTPALVDVQNCPNNQPPVIAPTPESAAVGGEVTIDLASITSDPDNNLDLSTLIIVVQPSSGALATLNANHVLTVDYQGITFSGTDRLTIQVCDLDGACAQKEIDIQVSGNVIVYNAISPNGDSKNDEFILEFIDLLPSTQGNRVTIYNRWGDEVFDISDYNNTSRIFTGISSDGKSLPSGTYFYKVVFTSGSKTLTGYLELKR